MLIRNLKSPTLEAPRLTLPLSSLQKGEGVGLCSLGLRHWAMMPPAPRLCVSVEREGPRTAAEEPSAAWADGGSPVFVYKPGSACERNMLLFQAHGRHCPLERRGCRAPGI